MKWFFIDSVVQSTSEQYCDEARASAAECGFDEFESWLTTGGDDRSLILDSGANKYHIKPQPIDDSHVFRGSCTGNPPTRRGYDAAKVLFEKKLKGLKGPKLDSALTTIFGGQRKRLTQYLNLPEGAEIVLCPSGSDAEYIPVALAKCLHPTKQIVNGVTQLNEIGSGTAPAAIGEFFSTHAPFLGANHEECLSGFEGIDGYIIPARKSDGEVVNASKKMREFCAAQLKENKFPIVHGVFGGKTGVRDSEMPGSLEAGEKSIGVVDACQGRFSLEEMNSWMKNDSIVLFTTSKFYQAPPFCGAVILPPSISEKLYKAPPPKDMLTGETGLGAFVTDKELPSCLKSWKSILRDDSKNNVGLALRWEAGLAAMEALCHISDDEKIKMYEEWASTVRNMVDEAEMIDTFCVERSIVSIRIAKNDGSWLNMDEARDLYRWMSLDVLAAIPAATLDEKAALSTPAYIGQPVDVSKSHAIVRIALGAESLLSYEKSKGQILKEDELTVKKLATIAKYFDTLKSSYF